MRHLLVVIFLGFFAVLVAVQVVLLMAQSVPMFHDSFLYLQMQYVFFNEETLHGQIPLWMPFVTGGVRAGNSFIQTAGILSLVVSPLASVLKGANFLPIFTAGVVFDEFVLLLGCVLLAKRYFNSFPTVVFVVAAVVFTESPTTQLYWNFHVFYMIPLILYCLDRAVRDASVKYVFLSSIFIFANVLANILYLGPLWLFAALIFGLASVVVAPRLTTGYLIRFGSNLGWRHLLAAVIPAIGGSSIIFIAVGAFGEITVRKLGRSLAGGISSLSTAISFGPDPTIQKYYGMVDVYANDVYLTVYVGLLVLPFVVVAMVRARSKFSYAFGITGLILVLFSSGTLVSALFYYLVPFASLYRYVSLSTRLATFFVIFYAGYGFDAYLKVVRLRSRTQTASKSEQLTLLAPILVLGVTLLLVYIIEFKVPPLFVFLTPGGLSNNPSRLDPAFILPQPEQVLLLLSAFIWILVAMIMFPRSWKLILFLVLALHVVDVFTFHVEAESDRGQVVNQNFVDMFNKYDYNFSTSRIRNETGNLRYLTTNSFDRTEYSWGSDTFWFRDFGIPTTYTDSWPTPLDNLNWAFVSQGKGGYLAGVFQPPNSTAYQKIVALNGYSKLAVFRNVHVMPTTADEQSIITSPRFSGDFLLASQADGVLDAVKYPVVLYSNDLNLTLNERLQASITVEAFSFDQVKLHVDTRSASPAVLYYADTWDPKWNAFVNGVSVPVIRADIAYKAVPIPAGQSEVTFVFGNWTDGLAVDGVVSTGFLAFLGVIFLSMTELRKVDDGVALSSVSETNAIDRNSRLPKLYVPIEKKLQTLGETTKHLGPLAQRTPLAFLMLYPIGASVFLYFGANIFPGPIQLRSDSIAPLPAIAGGVLLLVAVGIAALSRKLDEIDFASRIFWVGIILDLGLTLVHQVDLAFNDLVLSLGSSEASIFFISHALFLVLLWRLAKGRQMQAVYWAGLAFVVLMWFAIPLCPGNSCPPPSGAGILPLPASR